VVFFGGEFLPQFQGFLITLGVPVAAWCGVMLADIALRRSGYAESELFDPAGRYGDVRWFPIAVVTGCTAIGWGLVTNSMAGWLGWQGYLLDPLGLGGREGAWAYANLGVLVALVLAFVATYAGTRTAVRDQEAAAGTVRRGRPGRASAGR
jgi:NCS1 family nucleobase:cation symporter-1